MSLGKRKQPTKNQLAQHLAQFHIKTVRGKLENMRASSFSAIKCIFVKTTIDSQDSFSFDIPKNKQFYLVEQQLTRLLLDCDAIVAATDNDRECRKRLVKDIQTELDSLEKHKSNQLKNFMLMKPESSSRSIFAVATLALLAAAAGAMYLNA